MRMQMDFLSKGVALSLAICAGTAIGADDPIENKKRPCGGTSSSRCPG